MLNRILHRLALRALLAALIAPPFGAGAEAADLGAKDEPIKLVVAEWTGQHVTTHIAGQLLEKMGYKVQYITAGAIRSLPALQTAHST